MNSIAAARSKPHEHRCAGLVPLFANLPQSDQNFIDEHLQHQQFSRNEMVFMPGDELKLIIVARGSLKIYQMSSNGREQLLRVQKAGGYEGEAWMLGYPNDSLYGQTLEPAEVCLLSHQLFHKLLVEQPLLSIRMLEMNTAKFVEMEWMNGILSIERTEGRLARYLLDQSETTGSQQFVLPVKMNVLARLIGTTPETLSRDLRSLEIRGFIARRRNLIHILDSTGLATL
ncbi:Crp/Fnr family transcriptional regulator [Bifidobacterium aquikefiri]